MTTDEQFAQLNEKLDIIISILSGTMQPVAPGISAAEEHRIMRTAQDNYAELRLKKGLKKATKEKQKG